MTMNTAVDVMAERMNSTSVAGTKASAQRAIALIKYIDFARVPSIVLNEK